MTKHSTNLTKDAKPNLVINHSAGTGKSHYAKELVANFIKSKNGK